MTRETKVGIVVSCSFLGLVGVVIASKLHEKPEDATERPPSTAVVQPPPAARTNFGKGKPREIAPGAMPKPSVDGPMPKATGSVPAAETPSVPPSSSGTVDRSVVP